MKAKLKFIKGSWVNDDVDLIPTIKLRTGSRINQELKVTATSLALCWLKWGVMVSFGRIVKLEQYESKTD
jgi:hypothetical protein